MTDTVRPRRAKPTNDEVDALMVVSDAVQCVQNGRRLMRRGRDVTAEVLAAMADQMIGIEPVRIGRRS